MAGKLIIFEGPDGVGKTTLVENTVNFLHAQNAPFVSLSFPGKTVGTLGHLVDRLHHTKAEFQIDEITPLALQALHVAAHLDSIDHEIKPPLHDGKAVLLDRIWWSTWVYGRVSGVNDAILSKLIEAEQLCWGDVSPSVVFLVSRVTAFRAEHSQETFAALSSLYEELAAREELRHPVVRISNDDLQLSMDTVRESIASILKM